MERTVKVTMLCVVALVAATALISQTAHNGLGAALSFVIGLVAGGLVIAILTHDLESTP